MEKKIEVLISAISDIVLADGSYKEKAAAIKAALSDDDRNCFVEFLAWFDEVDE